MIKTDKVPGKWTETPWPLRLVNYSIGTVGNSQKQRWEWTWTEWKEITEKKIIISSLSCHVNPFWLTFFSSFLKWSIFFFLLWNNVVCCWLETSYFMFHRRNKVIQAWNNMRLNKWLKYIFGSLSQLIIVSSHQCIYKKPYNNCCNTNAAYKIDTASEIVHV